MSMEARIVLSREKKYWCYGPGDRIEGKLFIDNPNKLFCSGIRVSLEAIVRVNFEEKVDIRHLYHSKIEDAISPKIFVYVWPINWSWAQITGKLDDERQMCLPSSKHIFPFSFDYPLTQLPGSFCGEFGSVTHQVVAYIKTPKEFHRIASQMISFGDYLNLAVDPVALKPLRFEKRKRSLMFSLVHSSSTHSPIEFTLKLSQRGYLPGDYSQFTLTVINITGKPLSKISVSFIQKVTYHTDKSKKIIGIVMDETETLEAEAAVETIWESGFYIPQGIKPSYKGSIEHQYFIKVQIYAKGGKSNNPTLKGHVPLIIGTTRNIEDGCGRCVRRSSRSHSAGVQNGRRTSLELATVPSSDRFSSVESPSTITELSPPPSYSQLSSRATSVDNFLPLYEDAMHNGRKLQGFIYK